MDLVGVLSFFHSHIQWVFSGVGVPILYFFFKKKKTKAKIVNEETIEGDNNKYDKNKPINIPELIILFDNIQIAQTRKAMWEMWCDSAIHAKKRLLATTRSVGYMSDYLDKILKLKNQGNIEIRLLAPFPKDAQGIQKLIERKNAGFDVRLHYDLFDELPFRYQLVDDDKVVLNIPSSNEPQTHKATVVSIAFVNKTVVDLLKDEFTLMWDNKDSKSLEEHVLEHFVLPRLPDRNDHSNNGYSLKFLAQACGNLTPSSLKGIMAYGIDKGKIISKSGKYFKIVLDENE